MHLRARIEQKLGGYVTFKQSASDALRDLLVSYHPEVVYLSAYTCEDVPRAARACGSPVRYLPVIPGSYLCAPRVPETGRVAVVVTHLHGSRAEVPPPRKGLFIIEDAAQAMGTVDSAPWSDATVYSVGPSKIVAMDGGGVIVARHRHQGDTWPLSKRQRLLDNLEQLPHMVLERKRLAEVYARELPRIGDPVLGFPVEHVPERVRQAMWSYSQRVHFGYTVYAASVKERARLSSQLVFPTDPELPSVAIRGLLARYWRLMCPSSRSRS